MLFKLLSPSSHHICANKEGIIWVVYRRYTVCLGNSLTAVLLEKAVVFDFLSLYFLWG
jgi:hypothetical protein